MSKVVQVKKDEETQDFYLEMDDFADIIDISKVEYYEVTLVEEGFTIQFYDKDENLIEPKV